MVLVSLDGLDEEPKRTQAWVKYGASDSAVSQADSTENQDCNKLPNFESV
jgi:hypothetical protein